MFFNEIKENIKIGVIVGSVMMLIFTAVVAVLTVIICVLLGKTPEGIGNLFTGAIKEALFCGGVSFITATVASYINR